MSTVSVNQIEGSNNKIIVDKDTRLEITTGLVLPRVIDGVAAVVDGGAGSLVFNEQTKDVQLVTPSSYSSSAGGALGSSADNAASSPAALQAAGITTDGGYWISLPSVGARLTYCAMNSGFQGGGWMLAWKCTVGTTFSYTSSYWSSTNTINETDMSRNNADAKYDVFNYYNATQIMAVFPTLNQGGQASGYGTGWSWLSTGQNTTLLNRFQVNQQLSGNPRGENMWSGSGFSAQGGFQWYGYNYNSSYNGTQVRWGFGWNNEGDQSSNDVGGGIGCNSTWGNWSCGDRINCCQSTSGFNGGTRAEIWIK